MKPMYMTNINNLLALLCSDSRHSNRGSALDESDGITTSVYLRRSKRYLDDRYVDCIDIAQVDCTPERKGGFKLLIAQIKQKWSGIIFVECVHNKNLASYLKREDWKIWHQDKSCFYK